MQVHVIYTPPIEQSHWSCRMLQPCYKKVFILGLGLHALLACYVSLLSLEWVELKGYYSYHLKNDT